MERLSAIDPGTPCDSADLARGFNVNATKTSLSELPTCLLESILERVFITSPSSFSAALVCRAWLSLSQQCISHVAVKECALLSDDELLPALCAFPRLSSLTLHRRSIGDFSSNFFVELTQHCPMLTHLHLQHIPGQLSLTRFNSPQLTHLTLHTRGVPKWVRGLSNLTHLELIGTWDLPAWMGTSLPKLTSLKLEASHLAAFPSSFSSLASLTHLRCELYSQSHLPQGIGALTAVTRLEFICPCWSSPDNEELCSLTNLKSLKLKASPALTSLPPALGCSLARLTSFTLSCGGSTEPPSSQLDLPSSFWGLRKLRILKLRGLCGKDIFLGIEKLTSLETLVLSMCNLSCSHGVTCGRSPQCVRLWKCKSCRAVGDLLSLV